MYTGKAEEESFTMALPFKTPTHVGSVHCPAVPFVEQVGTGIAFCFIVTFT
jgi:hypothetical protein